MRLKIISPYYLIIPIFLGSKLFNRLLFNVSINKEFFDFCYSFVWRILSKFLYCWKKLFLVSNNFFESVFVVTVVSVLSKLESNLSIFISFSFCFLWSSSFYGEKSESTSMSLIDSEISTVFYLIAFNFLQELNP